MLRLLDFPHSFLVWVAVPLGLVFGSFLNVVIHRLPRDESLAYPGSSCPACGTPIKGYDNIPVLSWLLLLGKARCCKAPISIRYPAIEALGGLVAWAILERIVMALPPTTPGWLALYIFCAHLFLSLSLIAAAFIDLENLYIPTELTVLAAVVGFVTSTLRPEIDWTDSLLGAAVGFLIIWLPFIALFKAIKGHEGMGLGDAFLLIATGAWFGWPAVVFSLVAGSVQGVIGAIIQRVSQGEIKEPEGLKREREELLAAIEAAEGDEKEELQKILDDDFVLSGEQPSGFMGAHIAFGPFLVLATLEWQLFGDLIWDFYMSAVMAP